MMKHQTLAMGAGAPRNVVPRDIKPVKESRPVARRAEPNVDPDKVGLLRRLSTRRGNIEYRAERMALEFVRHLIEDRPMEAEGALKAVIDSLEDMDRLDQTCEKVERAKYDVDALSAAHAEPAGRVYWALMVRRRTLLEVYSRSTAGEGAKRARSRIPGEYDEWPKEIMGHFDTEPSRAYNDAVHEEIQRRRNYEPKALSADELAKLRASIVKSGGFVEAARMPDIVVNPLVRAIEDGLAAATRARNEVVQNTGLYPIKAH